MDFLIIALILIYAFIGFYRGAIRMLFSLLRVALLLLLCYYLSERLTISLVGSSLWQGVYEFLKNIFDGLLPGEFQSMSEVLYSVGLMSNVVMRLILQAVLKNITFEGSMSFGEIVAPTLTLIFLKVVLFILLFILLSILFKLIDFVLRKCVKFAGLGKVNRLLGFFLGAIKGFVVSMIVFTVLTFLSSLNISDGLTSFVESGLISSYLYNHYFLNIFNLFY
ncbi:MAG TPA: CvpA family protein [Candidatus Caccovivens faecavium]|nr:CvpA family protein [Candidatus Caccovivens faecavium]